MNILLHESFFNLHLFRTKLSPHSFLLILVLSYLVPSPLIHDPLLDIHAPLAGTSIDFVVLQISFYLLSISLSSDDPVNLMRLNFQLEFCLLMVGW